MRRAFYSFGAIVAIVVIAILTLPAFISADDVKSKIFAQVESATGLRIRVDGPVSISMLPFLDLVAKDVGVSRPQDGGGEILSADSLRFGLSFTGLLSGNVRMTEVALVSPVVTVPETAATSTDAAPTRSPDAPEETASALRSLSLDRLSIVDGTVILPPSDGKPGTRIEGLDLTASLAAFDGPLTFDGSARVDGADYAAAGNLDTFGPMLDGTATPVRVTLTAPSILAVPADIEGTLVYGGDSVGMDAFTLKAGDSLIEGAFAADLAGDVPDIRVSLSGETVDVDALTAMAKAPASARAAPAASTNDPIDLSALSSVAATIDLSFSRLVVAGNVIQPLVGSVRVGGGKLDAVADIIGLAGASGAASLAIDATQPNPYVSGKLRVSGVDIAEMSRIAGTAIPLTGLAGADIVYATAGRTMTEWQGRINASGTLSLSDGTLTGLGAAALTGNSASDRVEAIAVTATLTDLTSPVSLSGSARWNGEPFEISATGDVRDLIAGKPASVEARAASQRVTGGFAGTVSAAGAVSGRVSLDTPSLTGMMRWLGQEPGWQSGFETFSVAGLLTMQDKAIAFEDATIRLDETRGKGFGRVVLGAVPQVNAQLDLERLDLNPYLGAATAGRPGTQAAPPAATAAGGWSDAPMDFSALRSIGAKLTISTGELIYKDIKAGPVSIAAVIDQGRLTADMPSLGLYGGTGSGTVTVDASAKVPTQQISFTLSGLDAHPFLVDAAGFGRIEGTAEVALDVSGAGTSQRAIVSALNGTASFKFTDGAVRGINVAKMVRSLTSGTLSGWQQGEAEKTDFASLGASFRIDNGKAVNQDLSLVGPLVRVSGSGEIDMPAQTLAFRVDPQVVASLEGQGGRGDLEGLGVPVMISGPWSRPSIYPDIAGILQNPAAAYEKLRALGGGLFNLPAAGDSGAPVAGVVDDIRQKTGVDVGGLVKDGKIDSQAVQDQAIQGLNRLLQGQQGGQQQPQAQQPTAQQPTVQRPRDQQQGGRQQGGRQSVPDASGADPVQTGSVRPNDGPAGRQPADATAEQPPADPTMDATRQLLDSLFGKRN